MDKNDINKRIIDRSECFYWQTDRRITVEEQTSIWKNRHEGIYEAFLENKIKTLYPEINLEFIKPIDEKSDTSLGNVNSIRVGVLASGEEVIIRCHPMGIENGYFHVESKVAEVLKENGLPGYKTLAIHDLEDEDDIAFQIIEKLPGVTIQTYLKHHPEDEEKMVYLMGEMMAKIHKIKVEGFGPFNNKDTSNLVGIHASLSDALNAGLEENLNRLITYNVISEETAIKMKDLFKDNKLLDVSTSVLVHNDFADWNILTDGKRITGILDLDECVAGSPIEEIACFSTFFDPVRLEYFLEGYFSVTPKFDNFDCVFELMRLRYTISKMALRVKRYSYDKSEFLKNMIEKGEKHLSKSCEYFKL